MGSNPRRSEPRGSIPFESTLEFFYEKFFKKRHNHYHFPCNTLILIIDPGFIAN